MRWRPGFDAWTLFSRVFRRPSRCCVVFPRLGKRLLLESGRARSGLCRGVSYLDAIDAAPPGLCSVPDAVTGPSSTGVPRSVYSRTVAPFYNHLYLGSLQLVQLFVVLSELGMHRDETGRIQRIPVVSHRDDLPISQASASGPAPGSSPDLDTRAAGARNDAAEVKRSAVADGGLSRGRCPGASVESNGTRYHYSGPPLGWSIDSPGSVRRRRLGGRY